MITQIIQVLLSMETVIVTYIRKGIKEKIIASSLEIATVVKQDDSIFQDRNAVQSSTS